MLASMTLSVEATADSATHLPLMSVQPAKLWEYKFLAQSSVPPTQSVGRSFAGTDSEMIATTQNTLARLGYQPGPVDGIMGNRTHSAIREFQRAEGIQVDGQLSESLFEHLRHAQAQLPSYANRALDTTSFVVKVDSYNDCRGFVMKGAGDVHVTILPDDSIRRSGYVNGLMKLSRD